jgi:hypothetical protein
VQRLVVAVVRDPHLRLDEDLGAVNPRRGDRLADLALVAIGGGGVDVPVAGFQCGADGVARLVGRRLEDAQADGRHLDVVVELQRSGGRRAHVLSSSRVMVGRIPPGQAASG